MGKLVVVGIEGHQSVDIVALALGLGPNRLGLLQRGEPEDEIVLGRGNMRVEQQTERNSPIGDGAVGIGLDRLLEYLLGLPIPERVLVAHPAVEAPLRRFVA